MLYKAIRRSIFFTCVMALGMGSAWAETYTEGVHYQRLSKEVRTDNPDKIEVREFFGYWCPHCNSFERHLRPWKRKLAADVNFVTTPVIFRPNQEEFAKAYYVSQALGVSEQTHSALFNLIHRQKQWINNAEELQKFFANYGVSAEDFNKAYGSFSLGGQLRLGKKRAQDSQITGVPSIIVNGKYQVSAETAGGQRNMLKVVDYLVDLERAAN